MIPQSEVSRIASKLNLRDTQIEKDYVISWVIRGISQNKFLSEMLIFKGGTAIRKGYIKDYRLSEDLDFTFIENNFNTVQIKNEFSKVNQWIKDVSRIDLEIGNEKINTFENYSFDLNYNGPLGGKNKSIKVDVCSDEKIHNPPEKREIFNQYSDLQNKYSILCYPMKEIIAEKMRSLIQRTQPRDLYDTWYLLEVEGNDITEFIDTFLSKANNKKLDPYKLKEKLDAKRVTFKSSWENNLKNQINDIPDFDRVWRELNKHLRKFKKNL